jgi:hypothetical protein
LLLSQQIAFASIHRSNSTLDMISFTNNWVGYHLPLYWTTTVSETFMNSHLISSTLMRTGYTLFSGPIGVWQVRRAPSVTEARAMSLSLLADGVKWQRVFAWPPSSVELATGLGALDHEVALDPVLTQGTRTILPTSHPHLQAILFNKEGILRLLIINRNSAPIQKNITLILPNTNPHQFVSISPVLTATMTEVAPELIWYQPRPDDHISITLKLAGWNAVVYKFDEHMSP